jgi:hypothetical protein
MICKSREEFYNLKPMNDEEIERNKMLCQNITQYCFLKKRNNKPYFVNEDLEVKQFIAEYTEKVLTIVLGDQSITIEELIKGSSYILHQKIKDIKTQK